MLKKAGLNFFKMGFKDLKISFKRVCLKSSVDDLFQKCIHLKNRIENIFKNFLIPLIKSQVRIAEADNTAQYWPNLGSQQSAIVIGPVPPFASVKCCADGGGLCRLFKFTDFQPELGPVSALY